MESSFAINSVYSSNKFKENFFKQFRSSSRTVYNDDNGPKIIHEPFDCAVLPNFLDTSTDAGLIGYLESEIRRLPLNRRQNDLFSLHQSDDLKSLWRKEVKYGADFPLLRDLQKFFASTLLSWMEEVTGAKLDKGEVNSTVSRYEPHDYLLCHDDELERRRIAFIIYLVPDDWSSETEGGCLDMIASGPSSADTFTPEGSGDYHPWRTVVSLPPKRNCLAFFEVCSKSFHQVAEIIGDRDRLSVHGWFMSDPLPRTPRNRDPLTIPRLTSCFIEEALVYKWINPLYLVGDQQKDILRRFLSSSEISLPQFLKESEWRTLCKTMRSIDGHTWIHEGPMDLRNISVLPYIGDNDGLESHLPEPVRQVRRLLRSEAMLVILTQLTGVTLHTLSEDADTNSDDDAEEATEAKRRKTDNGNESVPPAELTTPRFHRWKSGMYTLLADADSTVFNNEDKRDEDANAIKKWRLDLIYHIGGYGTQLIKKKEKEDAEDKAKIDPSSHWDSSWNGQIIYTSRSDNEELLRVSPEDNALSLVYCNSDAGRFVRYLNSLAKPILSGLDEAEEKEKEDSSVTPFAYDVFVSYFDPLPHESDEADLDVNEYDGDDDDNDGDDNDDISGEENGSDVDEGANDQNE